MASHCIRVLWTLSVPGIMMLALVFGVGVFADDHHSVDLSPFFIWEGEKITQPVVGEQLTAALVADDPTGMTWQWARSRDGESGWEDIEAATSARYSPTTDDAGHYLRATVSYTDGDGNAQSAEAITSDRVVGKRSGTRCPQCEPGPIWTPTPDPDPINDCPPGRRDPSSGCDTPAPRPTAIPTTPPTATTAPTPTTAPTATTAPTPTTVPTPTPEPEPPPPDDTPTPTPLPRVNVAAPSGLSLAMTGSLSSRKSCSAKFTWNVPTGAVAYEYEAVEVGVEDQSPRVPVQPPHGPDNEWVFYGLWCSTEYDFRVKARGNGSNIWRGDRLDVIYTKTFSDWATKRATTGPYTPPPNSAPKFAVDREEVFFHVGQVNTIALPVATGGNGDLTYTLSTLGTGLTFDEDNHQINIASSGPVAADQLTYTLSAHDSDSDTSNADADTTEIVVNFFNITIVADHVEYRGPTSLPYLQTSVYDRLEVGVSDAVLTRSRDYKVQFSLPDSTGYKLKTHSCAAAILSPLWSGWLDLNGATEIHMVRCGLGARGSSSVPVEIQYDDGGITRTVELATLSLTFLQARHHPDNVASYQLRDPWIGITPPSYSTYDVIAQDKLASIVTTGKNAWSTTDFRFSPVTSSPDIYITGYFLENNLCGGDAIACISRPSATHYAGTRNLQIEFPPKGVEDDPRNWTVERYLLNSGQTDYFYLPAVVVHEMGHGAGLGHPDNGEYSIMSQGYQERIVTVTSLDITAISKLYSGHTPH